MEYIIFIISLFLIFILRKSFSETYFSPTGLFCFLWMFLVALMFFVAPEFYFSFTTVFYIVNFTFFFFIGEFIFFILNKKRFVKQKSNVFYDDNFQRRFRKYTIIISLTSLVGSLYYFKSFLNHYGSFAEFLIAGSLIREDLFAGNIAISSLSIFAMLLSYTSINLALVYYTKYGFKWFQIIPFLTVIIASFSQAARAGIVIVVFQIFAAKIFRLITLRETKIEFKLLKPIFYIFPFLVFIFFIVEMFRYQNFEISSDNLVGTLNVFNIYTFGGVAGFSSYLSDIELFSSPLTYGRYTFSSLYNILGIAQSEPGIYNQYLNISPKETANIYSIFRPLLEDFGYLGMILWAFYLGIISNFIFYKSINGFITYTSFGISIYIYLMFSFIAPLTQFNSFLLSCFLGPAIIQLSKIKFTFKI